MTQGVLMKDLVAKGLIDPEPLIKNANKLLNNEFIFTHPYDMEPYHESVQMTDIDWLYTPNNDPEWIYMLNRHEYLLDLLTVFYITDNPVYLVKIKVLILDWLAKCQATDSAAWRTIDTGIRMLYWAICFDTLVKEDILSQTDSQKIKASLTAQGEFLDDHYIDKYDLSNWGILISSGIVVTANLISDVISLESCHLNQERLKRQVSLQVQASGLHWEQSPLYFMEVWRQLTAVYLSYDETLVSCPEIIERAIAKMLEVAPFLVKPNGYLLQQGDTDSIKINDMIQTVSLLLEQPILAVNLETKALDSLLMSFSKSVKKFTDQDLLQQLSELSKNTKETFLIDQQTGNYFYRDDWSKEGSYLHVFNGPLSSGHGHASLGHFDYSVKGQDIFIDPGRYTYCEVPARMSLKAADSHNVLVVDQQPMTVIRDAWGYHASSTPLATLTYVDEEVRVTQLTYVDQQGIKIQRSFIWLLAEDLLVVTDYCLGTGSHAVAQTLILDPAIKVSQTATSLELRAEEVCLYLQSNYQQQTLTDSLFSATYNQISQTKKILSQSQFTDSFFGYSLVSSDPQARIQLAVIRQSGSSEAVPVHRCSGLEITTARSSYLLGFQPEDTYQGHKLYFINEEPVYGKLVLLTKQPTSKKYQRLL